MTSEDEVAGLQAQLMKAVFSGDTDACERWIGTNCSIIRADPEHMVEVLLRENWLAEIARGPHDKAAITDRVVSAHGDIVVASVLWVEDSDAAEPRRHSLTDIWKKNEEGQWQVVERHAL